MSDDARQTAFDPGAPRDERFEAQSEIQRAYMPLASALMPREDLASVIDYIRDQYADQHLLSKATVIPFPGRHTAKKGMQSVYLDGLQIFAFGDYFERPSPVGYDALRLMVEQTPILNAVILTRIRQVQRFAQIQDDKGPGFVIRHADRHHKMSRREEDEALTLAKVIANCGWEFNPRRRKALKRDSLAQFMAKLVRETLTYDSAPIETEMKRDASHGIDGFYSVDGSTIRLCTEEGYEGDDRIIAVQVVQGRVMTLYTHDDLIYEPRNPRSDVRLAGYGLGETELMIRVVTGFLNALQYNTRGFDDNSIPKGILHLTGEYSEKDLVAFRRYWNAMVRGIQNTWTLPVMVSRDADSKATFERIDMQFNEMYFAKWMTFLVSIICAIYGMSPAEINFDAFSGGSTSPLSGSDTAEKLAASRDSGLRPLLAYLENTLSDFIVSSFGDRYLFRWAGIDAEDEQQRHEMRKLTMTLNEARAQENLPPLAGPIGDVPLNPSLIGPWLQLQQGGDEAADASPDQSDDDQQEFADEQDPETPRQLTKAWGRQPFAESNQGANGPPSAPPRSASHAQVRALRKANPHHGSDGRFAFADGERRDLAHVSARVVRVTLAPSFSHQNDRSALKIAAVTKLKQWPKDGVLNEETGWMWIVGRDDWKKMAGWDRQTMAGLKAISGLDGLVHAAVRAETHQDGKGNPNVIAVHRFYCPALIEDTLQRVKLTVKEYVFEDGRARRNLHALEAVEIDNPGERLLQGPQGVLESNPPAQAPGSEISMVALLAGVNRDSDGLPFGTPAAVAPLAKALALSDDDAVKEDDSFAEAVPLVWAVDA